MINLSPSCKESWAKVGERERVARENDYITFPFLFCFFYLENIKCDSKIEADLDEGGPG